MSEALPRKYNIKIRIFTISAVRESGLYFMGKAEVMSNMDQECLKYQKLYNWAHTLITSGVIKNMDKFPSEPSLQKKFGYSRQTVRTALQKLEEGGAG